MKLSGHQHHNHHCIVKYLERQPKMPSGIEIQQFAQKNLPVLPGLALAFNPDPLLMHVLSIEILHGAPCSSGRGAGTGTGAGGGAGARRGTG